MTLNESDPGVSGISGLIYQRDVSDRKRKRKGEKAKAKAKANANAKPKASKTGCVKAQPDFLAGN